VIKIFGPNTEQVLAFLARLSDLSAEEIGTVTDTWRQTKDLTRAEAWAQVHRVTTDRERCWVMAAAAVARQVALDAASRHHWTDCAFSAAASNAGAAIVAGDRIGRHHKTLISPLAVVMPWLPLAHGEAPSVENVPDDHRLSGSVLQPGA
jgi:hypothetical protein